MPLVHKIAACALCLLFTLAATGYATAQSQAEEDGQDERYVLLTEFASGDRFYLDKASFRSIGNGQLEYHVKSAPDEQGQTTETLNRVDCTTGTFQSQIQAQTRDAQGHVRETRRFYPRPLSLPRNSPIYELMKAQCRENVPGLTINW